MDLLKRASGDESDDDATLGESWAELSPPRRGRGGDRDRPLGSPAPIKSGALRLVSAARDEAVDLALLAAIDARIAAPSRVAGGSMPP